MTDRLLSCVVVASLLAATAGCADVGAAPTASGDATRLPRPDRVVVYDFTVSADQAVVPGDPFTASDPSEAVDMRLDAESPTAASGPIARSVAAALSDELVSRIRAMGLPAERAAGAAPVAGAVRLPGDSLAIEGQVRAVEATGQPQQGDVGADLDTMRVTTAVQAYLVRGDVPQLVEEIAGSADGAAPSGTGSGLRAAETAGQIRQRADAYARRTADRIARGLAQFFAAEGWIAGHSSPP